jgi:hypothetical protein
MATINYFGLTKKGTVTVNLTVTIDQLITAIATDEVLATEYYTVSAMNDFSKSSLTYGDSSTTLTQLGLVDGGTVLCTTNQTGSKQERQLQKLAIAAKNRTVDGYTSVTLDTTQLPTLYSGNTVVDNANSGGLLVGRPWSPSAVGVVVSPTTITESINSDTLLKLQAWYDAADTATFTPSPSDESSITQWQDKSTLSHNANSTGSKKPTYENTILRNGYGYVEFDGVNDIMNVNPFTQLQNRSGYTVFLVSQLADTTGIQYITETDQNDLRMNSNETTMEVGMRGAVGTVASEATTGWSIHTLVFDGTQTGNAARLVYRRNRTAKTLSFTGTVAATTNGSNSKFCIGNSDSEASPMAGYIAELILFDKTLTAIEYGNVENYLYTKYIPYCFTAGSLVTMADGSTKAIETVLVGEKVMGNEGATNTVIELKHYESTIRSIFVINNLLETTEAHPILTTNGWKSFSPETSANQYPELTITLLEIGNVLVKYNTAGVYSEEVIETITNDERDISVYNLDVDGNDTFIIHDIVVHNK